MHHILRTASRGSAWALVAGLSAGVAQASDAATAPLSTVSEAATETVLDFRPRIGAPRGPSARQQVHLHLYRQTPTARDCGREALEQQRVGLVLSGGVSKGLAFVGALQVLDEIGLRIDRVAGTSMGAVIGAFYAAGYPPDHLYNRFQEPSPGTKAQADVFGAIDWRTMFTDVPQVRSLTLNQLTSWGLGEGQGALPRSYQLGLRSGQNLTAELGKYLLAATAASEGCFDDLYVPFVASSTSVTAAETRRLVQGDLAVAVRASLSYPLLFTPTFIDGERHIDGGMLDNFPVRAFIEEQTALEKQHAARQPAGSPAGVPGYSVILGFDVSDTNVGPLPAASVLQATSLAEAYTAIEGGVGASISRETGRSTSDLDPCNFAASPKPGPRPCLFRVKLDRPGGFTDFDSSQIADFVQAGRAMTLWKLCEALGKALPASRCAEDLSAIAEGKRDWSSLSRAEQSDFAERTRSLGQQLRQALCQPQGGRCQGPWRHLLQETAATLDSAGRLPALQGHFRDRMAELRREADRLLAGGTLPEPSTDTWQATLEGVELLWERGQVRVIVSPTLKDERPRRDALLRAAVAQLDWLAGQLAGAADGRTGDPAVQLDGGAISRLTVTASDHVLRVRVTNWTYRFSGLVRQHRLTERQRLVDARLDYWGLRDMARLAHVARVQRCHGVAPPPKSDQTPGAQPERAVAGCHPEAVDQPKMKAGGGGEGASWHVALDSRHEPPSPPSPVGPWWNQIWRHLNEKDGGQGLDVRYGNWRGAACKGGACQNSLSEELETLLERYYAIAAVEHIRLEGIRPGLLEIGEKPTHRSSAGGLFFGYQYDYRNKHSFGLRYVYESAHDSRWKPTRVLLGVAANEPLSDADGALLVDAKLLFLPSVNVPVPDYSLNPYAARRVHRIADGRSTLSWAERGLIGTVSGRMPELSDWFSNGREVAVSWALAAKRRWLDVAQGGPMDEWRQRLQDPSIGLERHTVSSLVGTLRAMQFWGEATLLYPVSVGVHRSRGRNFNEVVGDFRYEQPVQLWGGSRLLAARIFASRIKPFGGEGSDGRPPVPVPHDELYSAGGQYPFTERAAWGRKRFDYLGADLNELWGSRAYGLEARASVWRIDGLSYFAPYARLQVDGVLQTLKIGFPLDPARRTRNAYGLIASAYIPNLGSLRPRFSLSAGREFGGPLRLFASMDVLI